MTGNPRNAMVCDTPYLQNEFGDPRYFLRHMYSRKKIPSLTIGKKKKIVQECPACHLDVLRVVRLEHHRSAFYSELVTTDPTLVRTYLLFILNIAPRTRVS